MDHLCPMLGVSKFLDRHAAGLRGLLQDLFVDQPIAQRVGYRSPDQFTARTHKP